MTEMYLVKVKATQPMIWNGSYYEKDQEFELTVTQSEAKLLKKISQLLTASPCEVNKTITKKVKNNGAIDKNNLANPNNGKNNS